MLEFGITMGLLEFTAVIILVEKLPLWLKRLVLGHHLLSDILFFAMAIAVFPLTGAATIVSASIFALLCSGYLATRRKSHPWTKIQLGGRRVIRVVRFDPANS